MATTEKDIRCMITDAMRHRDECYSVLGDKIFMKDGTVFTFVIKVGGGQ